MPEIESGFQVNSRSAKDPRALLPGEPTVSRYRDHTKLTYKSQGRDFRLTVVGGKVVRELLA